MCPKCKSVARPAILMFGDAAWADCAPQAIRFEAFCDSLRKVATEKAASAEVADRGKLSGGRDAVALAAPGAGSARLALKSVASGGEKKNSACAQKSGTPGKVETHASKKATLTGRIRLSSRATAPLAGSPTSRRRLRVAILEFGAGQRVRTLRLMSERDLGRNLAELGADVGIVRVNPQEADPDDIYGVSPLEEGADSREGSVEFVSLACGAVEALRGIDRELSRMSEWTSARQAPSASARHSAGAVLACEGIVRRDRLRVPAGARLRGNPTGTV